MKIHDIMTRDPSCVTPNATIREAALVMKREDVGIVPVVDGRPAKGMSFSAQVEVDPRVPAANAKVAGRTSLETNGTFQLITQ